MPLWTDAYLGDTRHLSTIEHGAYLLLLMIGWRSGGSLPDDDKVLAKYAGLTGAQWARMAPTIRAFFTVEGGRIFQPRQRDELDHVRQVRNSKKAGGFAKSLKIKERHSANAEQMQCVRTPPTPTPTPLKEREDKSSPKKPASRAEALPDWLPLDAWNGWLEMRQSARKPASARAKQMAIEKLEAMHRRGKSVAASLDQSTMRGWTDLYEPKSGGDDGQRKLRV